MGKPWKNHRKTTGKPWENHGENGGLLGFDGIYPLEMGGVMGMMMDLYMSSGNKIPKSHSIESWLVYGDSSVGFL